MHGWKLEIKLDMQPFRYQKSVEPLVFTTNGTINNPGSVYSEPVIEIEGDGEISLTIGKKTMYLNITRKATIDCRHKKQNIYNAKRPCSKHSTKNEADSLSYRWEKMV